MKAYKLPVMTMNIIPDTYKYILDIHCLHLHHFLLSLSIVSMLAGKAVLAITAKLRGERRGGRKLNS